MHHYTDCSLNLKKQSTAITLQPAVLQYCECVPYSEWMSGRANGCIGHGHSSSSGLVAIGPLVLATIAAIDHVFTRSDLPALRATAAFCWHISSMLFAFKLNAHYTWWRCYITCKVRTLQQHTTVYTYISYRECLACTCENRARGHKKFTYFFIPKSFYSATVWLWRLQALFETLYIPVPRYDLLCNMV